jgi:O-antigen ligase
MEIRAAVTPAARANSWQVWADWCFLAWVALIPVMQPFHLRVVNRFWLQPADVAFIPAFLLFAFSVLTGKRSFRWTPWAWLALLYLGTLALSACASENRRQSFLKLPIDGYVIVGAILTTGFVSDVEMLRRTLLAWLAGAAATICAIVAGVGLFLAGYTAQRHNIFLFGFGTLPPGHYPRIRALFLDGNMFCSYAVTSAMIVLAAYEAGWIGRGTLLALFWGCAIGSMLAISPGTGGIFLAVGLWCSRGGKGKPLAAAGILAAAAFLAIATISPAPIRYASLWETLRRAEPSVRVLTWTGAWRTFLAHPWLGRGLDLPVAQVNYVTASGSLQRLTDAHNTWLSIMAQDGLPGLIAFCALSLLLLDRMRRRSANRAPLQTALELAFVGGVLYQFPTESLENTRHVWLAMGLLAASGSVRDETNPDSQPPPGMPDRRRETGTPRIPSQRIYRDESAETTPGGQFLDAHTAVRGRCEWWRYSRHRLLRCIGDSSNRVLVTQFEEVALWWRVWTSLTTCWVLGTCRAIVSSCMR